LTTTDDPTGANGYPGTWAQFTLTNAGGLPSSGQGRIAFRYFVEDGGPSGANSSYIGIDTVSITAGAVNTAPVTSGGTGITPASAPVSIRGKK